MANKLKFAFFKAWQAKNRVKHSTRSQSYDEEKDPPPSPLPHSKTSKGSKNAINRPGHKKASSLQLLSVSEWSSNYNWDNSMKQENILPMKLVYHN